MKKVSVIVIGLALLLIAGLAFARPWGMMGPNAAVTAEQQKFFDETKDLRKQVHDKRFELRELYRTPNADKAKIDALESEVAAIRTQLQDKARELNVAGGRGFGGYSENCPNYYQGAGPGSCGTCPQEGNRRGRGMMQGRMMM